MMLLLIILLSLTSFATPASFDFGLIDDEQCSSYGLFVEDIAFSVGNVVAATDTLGDEWSSTPPGFANCEYVHVSLCVTQDGEGDDQFFINAVFSNYSSYTFGESCTGDSFTFSFLIKPKYNITGAVTLDTLIPINGADVLVSTSNGDVTYTTGIDGEYNLLPLPEGEYTLYVNAEGYYPTSTTIVIDGDSIVTDISLTPKPVNISALVTFDSSFSVGFLQLTFEIDLLCTIVDSLPACDCSPSVLTTTSTSKQLDLSNAVGCHKPGAFAVFASILALDADITVTLTITFDGTTTVTTYTRNTATFLGAYWRVCSVYPGGLITFDDDVILTLDGLL